LELFMPSDWITTRIDQQRWQSIQAVITRIEELVTSGNIQGIKVNDMLETEPEWIPILTTLDGDSIVLLIENAEEDRFLSGQAYALIPRDLAIKYVSTQLN